jgi:cupin 2 domain-containing protein
LSIYIYKKKNPEYTFPIGMDKKDVKNIFSPGARTTANEVFETIIGDGCQFQLERIISEGHVTPDGMWYDQDRDEWVMLLAGSATLLFETTGETVTLTPGDYLNIPAHERHKVIFTDKEKRTIWLAIHYERRGGK